MTGEEEKKEWKLGQWQIRNETSSNIEKKSTFSRSEVKMNKEWPQIIQIESSHGLRRQHLISYFRQLFSCSSRRQQKKKLIIYCKYVQYSLRQRNVMRKDNNIFKNIVPKMYMDIGFIEEMMQLGMDRCVSSVFSLFGIVRLHTQNSRTHNTCITLIWWKNERKSWKLAVVIGPKHTHTLTRLQWRWN